MKNIEDGDSAEDLRLAKPFSTKQRLELSQMKLLSTEKTFRITISVGGLLFALAAIITSIQSIVNVNQIREDVTRYENTLRSSIEASSRQSAVAAEYSQRHADGLTDLVKERTVFWNEQIDRALKQARLIPGQASIEMYYDNRPLNGDTIRLPASSETGVPVFPVLRLTNTGDGTSSAVTAILYYNDAGFDASYESFTPSDVPGYKWSYAIPDKPALFSEQSMWLRFPRMSNFYGQERFMLKVFFGADAPYTATFTIVKIPSPSE